VSLERGADILKRTARSTSPVDIIALPQDREARLTDDACASIEAAYFSLDVFPDGSRQFFSTVRKAPALKWLHVFNVGVDHPIYTEMLQRGVRLTTSSGTTAQPIAHTVLAALLMLARNFPYWLESQRERRWAPMRPPNVPRDLQGQTAVIVGLGEIGKAIARLLRMLGLDVIGIRRSARTDGDPVDELYPPERLADVLPRADWLILACPLTAETRGLVSAEMLAALPPQARLINIARGEVVDEPALIDALRSGRLAGAYLDVFQTEPLAADSPLWTLPNVLLTPHNSAVASGNDERVFQMFLDNLERFQRGDALVNEVCEKA
jgi:phosphoglycerate dehydrogenase-like enzyme